MGTQVALLLRRKQVSALTGVNCQQLDKLVKAGALKIIQPAGLKGMRGYFRKEDIERIFQIKL